MNNCNFVEYTPFPRAGGRGSEETGNVVLKSKVRDFGKPAVRGAEGTGIVTLKNLVRDLVKPGLGAFCFFNTDDVLKLLFFQIFKPIII